ncbi:MAG: ARPP-1 family domain-containing protein [Dehalococcoidia bacterium]
MALSAHGRNIPQAYSVLQSRGLWSTRCADLFGGTQPLRAHWERLLRSYAMEAFGTKPVTPDTRSARRLLAYALGATRQVYSSPGLGLDHRYTNDEVVGSALVYEGAVIHASVFRRAHT